MVIWSASQMDSVWAAVESDGGLATRIHRSSAIFHTVPLAFPPLPRPHSPEPDECEFCGLFPTL